MKRLLIILAAPLFVCIAAWSAGFDFSTRGIAAVVTFIYSVTVTWFTWFCTKNG